MLKNMRIRRRLFCGFMVVLLIIIATICVTGSGTMRIANNLKVFYNQSYKISNMALSMKVSFENLEKYLYKAFMYNEKKVIEENITSAMNELENLNEKYEKMNEITPNDETLQQYSIVLEQLTPLMESINSDLTNNMKTRALKTINEEYLPLVNDANDLLNKLYDNSDANALAFIDKSETSVKLQLIIYIIAIIVNGIFILLVCFRITESIVPPLTEIKDAISSMAVGKLDSEITYQGKNEIGELSNDMKTTLATLSSYINNISDTLGKMSNGDMTVQVDMDYIGDFEPIKTSMQQIADSLRKILTKINDSAEQVTSSAEQVSSGAMLLSQGATEQASAIQQLSASISEVSEQVNNNAKNAEEASEISHEASEEVKRGYELMQQMMDAMEDIRKSSFEIETIIKVIDNIAFQTNILALNAAVEAARAGNAGKGFAVVADEVRNLAGKSAESAKNTTELIENAIKAVEKGTQIAKDTAKSLELIVEGATKSKELINSIAKASSEQSISIEQITLGVEQISSVVQTNSATAEQSASSSEELSNQAHALKELVSKFTLGDDTYNLMDYKTSTEIKKDLNYNIETEETQDNVVENTKY